MENLEKIKEKIEIQRKNIVRVPMIDGRALLVNSSSIKVFASATLKAISDLDFFEFLDIYFLNKFLIQENIKD